MRNSDEVLLRKVGERGAVTGNEAKDAREREKNETREMENRWKENMYGQYVSDMTEVDWEKTWEWLPKTTPAGKCKGRLNWNGKISGTNISQSEWWKMGISKFCGILMHSVIGCLKLEGRRSSSLISRQGRPRSWTLLSLEMY